MQGVKRYALSMDTGHMYESVRGPYLRAAEVASRIRALEQDLAAAEAELAIHVKCKERIALCIDALRFDEPTL